MSLQYASLNSVRDVPVEGLATWTGERVAISTEGLLVAGDGPAIDLGFARCVTLIPNARDVSRADFANAALTFRLKHRATTADISDLSADVDAALAAFQSGYRINVREVVLDEITRPVLELLKRTLNDAKLEALVGRYLAKLGATKVDIPAKNETGKAGDADIIATFEPLRTIIYVQAKKHDGETSDWAVRQVSAYVDYKAKKSAGGDALDDVYTRIAWVVSLADRSSEDCRKEAQIGGVQLISGLEFARMLLEAGVECFDEVQ